MVRAELRTDGVTRLVILTRRWAFKLPRFDKGWEAGVVGLLANMQECRFGRLGWPDVCPVRWRLWGGFLVVMPRAKPLSNAQWHSLDHSRFVGLGIPAENKRCSFGNLAGRIVVVDYG